MIRVDWNKFKVDFARYIQEFKKKSKQIVRIVAYDTGDMMRAISNNKVKRVGNSFVASVFVDRTKLYSKRKLPKNTNGKYDPRLYPIYVHAKKPFFNMAKGGVVENFRPRIYTESK